MPKRFRNTVGPSIRKARESAGMTQDDLAAKLQLTGLSLDRVSVAKIETQIRTVRDFELALFASVLKVAVSDLFPSKQAITRDLPALL